MLVNLKKSKYLIALVVAISIIGLYFRLKGLDKWPFALDEYYIIRAVQYILEHGLPQFDSGGYYSRGIIFQYLTATLVWGGLKAEFAARIIPVLINIMAIPGLYKLSRKLTNNTITILIILFFTFSLWEVEISRFARMYTFFQTIFVWYLYFLYKVLFEQDHKGVYWLWLLSIISIFIYEAAIFITLLNFIILFWNKEQNGFEFKLTVLKNNYNHLIASIIIILIAYLFISFDFRTLHQTSLLPNELADYFANLKKDGMIRMPVILIFANLFSFIGIALFLILINLGLFLALYITKNTDIKRLTLISILILISFAVFNLYGLFFISLIIFLLLDWIKFKDFSKKNSAVFVVIILSIFMFQNIFALVDNTWLNLTSYRIEPGLIGSIKILWKEFLNFPNLYEFFALFRDTYKYHTLFSALILFLGFLVLIITDKPKLKTKKIFFALFLSLLLLVTLLNTQWFETRYFFFLYPLFCICLFISIDLVVSKFGFNNRMQNASLILLGILFFIASEDINYNHLFNIDSEEINFRQNMSIEQRDHFYPRWDSRSVSEIVNSEVSEDDLIISDIQIVSYYLNRLDFLYRNYTANDFRIESVNEGKNERWTNAKLIYNYSDLIKTLSDENRVKWLIINKTYGIKEFEKLGFFDLIDKYLFYASSDGTTFLYKIPKTKFSDTSI